LGGAAKVLFHRSDISEQRQPKAGVERCRVRSKKLLRAPAPQSRVECASRFDYAVLDATPRQRPSKSPASVAYASRHPPLPSDNLQPKPPSRPAGYRKPKTGTNRYFHV
jgi:hypothetical protein